jgi:hypothetical protein
MAVDAETYRRREIGSKRMEEEAKKIQPLRPLSAADTDLEYLSAAKGGIISQLRRNGKGVSSELEAMRRMSQGHRVFVTHEQDERPREITSVLELHAYTPDQMYTLAPEAKANGGQVKRFDIGGSSISIDELSSERAPNIPEQFNRYIAPHINRGMDAMFPIRQLIQKKFETNVFDPINNSVMNDPRAALRNVDMNQADVREGKLHMQNAVRKTVGMEPLPQPRYDVKKVLGDINTGEFDPEHVSSDKNYERLLEAFLKKRAQPKAKGGVIDMDRMRLELMKDGGDVSKYRDPKTTKIQDWKWRKMQDVRKDMPIIEVPDYVQKNYGEFMNQQLARAKAAGLTSRDLLKAFTITQSSIGRGGLSHATATKTGMKLPNTGDEVRPEGAFAEWLGSPMGQSYLNAAERGMVHQPALNDIRQKFAPFGKHNQLTDQMIYATQNMPAMAQSLNQAITGSKEDYRNFAEKMRGVAGAKSGFIGSMLGRGDLPTLDARQLNLHALPADVSIGSIMSRGKGKGAREAVDRLTARQAAMNLKIDPSMQPHYQHLAHHAVWDAAGNNKTTHNDIIKAMRGYKAGGITHAHQLEIEERPL